MLLIGATEAIFLLLLLWQSLAYIEHSGEEALYRRASETSHLFSLLAKNAVISSDIASLDEITNQIAGLKDIRYIRVIDNLGVLAEAGDVSNLGDNFKADIDINSVNDGIFDAQNIVSVSGVEFAKVQVGLSVDPLLVFVKDARHRLLGIALTELLMVGLISLILGGYLTKGLLRLQEVALAVTRGDMTRRVENLPKDELGVTAKAFNVMLDKINSDQHKLNENAEHLLKAKQIAENASQAKSRFLSQMSHEIRSPMNAVLGAVNLVAEKVKEPPELFRLLKTAQSSGRALLDVVNEILDFSKIEAGHMELKYSEIELAPLLEDVLCSVEAKTVNNELTLIGDIAPNCMGRLVSDASHLRQIINILVDNACKFTDKGVVMVSVRCEVVSNGKEMLFVNVKDSGIGIEDASLTKIFNEFEQVDSTLESRTSGTGLGLNIAQGLIRLMGGTIGVNSILGEGSDFYFSVPVEFLSKPKFEKTNVDGPMVLVSNNHVLRHIFREKTKLMEVRFYEFDDISMLRQHVSPELLNNNAIWLIDDNVIHDESVVNNKWMQLMNININCISSLSVTLPKPFCDFNRLNRPIFCHDICYLASINTPRSTQKKKVDKKLDNNKTVLLVDDIEANRFIAGETLKNRGYKVSFACDGIEALEVLEHQIFDVILMDVRMPRMNGIDAVKKLKLTEGLNQCTPVIAMTANAEKSEMERCKAAGMEDFVGKPFDTQVLVDTINRCIYHSSNKNQDKLEPSQYKEKEEVLSQTVLNSLLKDTSEETVSTLIGFFIDDIHERIEMILKSIQQSDLEGIGEHAHALKSSAGSLGAMAMFTLCQNLEKASRQNELLKAKEIYEELIYIKEQTLIAYKSFHF